jgi:hypothetical protein
VTSTCWRGAPITANDIGWGRPSCGDRWERVRSLEYHTPTQKHRLRTKEGPRHFLVGPPKRSPLASNRGTIASAAPSASACATWGSARSVSADRGGGSCSPWAMASSAQPDGFHSVAQGLVARAPPGVHPGRSGTVTPWGPPLPSINTTYRAVVAVFFSSISPTGGLRDHASHAGRQSSVASNRCDPASKGGCRRRDRRRAALSSPPARAALTPCCGLSRG